VISRTEKAMLVIRSIITQTFRLPAILTFFRPQTARFRRRNFRFEGTARKVILLYFFFSLIFCARVTRDSPNSCASNPRGLL